MRRRRFVQAILSGLLLTSAAAPVVAQAPAPQEEPWWPGALIYEIYPRSFGDSNGDGVGDLKGIVAHLDHLQWLGVDAIWLTPINPSPQVDFGYDISDFEAIDPQYGSMADFDALKAAASKRGIRLLADMVLNHTSDRHAWFRESASSRDNAKADWYVWNDGIPAATATLSAVQRANVHEGRAPPNNWTSVFGGSSWKWVPARRQFYYHQYYVQQPDLNWRNPAVEKAMFDAMRFWLDRGVDGFRLDAITTLYEDPDLRSEPETGGLDPFGAPKLDNKYTRNLDEIHAVMRRLRTMVDGYPGNRVLIGETYLPDVAALARWYGGAAKDELHLPMDMLVGFGKGATYTPGYFRPVLADAQTGLNGAMPLLVFDNHDQRRSIDRFGDGVHDQAIAKGVAAMLLLSRATALTYYGAPLGMRTETPKRKEDVRDPVGVLGWPREKGRDGERTPMQWTAGTQAGFSSAGDTWLPVNPDYRTVNVAAAKADAGSLLNWYRRLIKLRRTLPALRHGAMTLVGNDPEVLAWIRADPATGSDALVAINMSAKARTLPLSALGLSGRYATVTATEGAKGGAGTIALPPYAVWVGRK